MPTSQKSVWGVVSGLPTIQDLVIAGLVGPNSHEVRLVKWPCANWPREPLAPNFQPRRKVELSGSAPSTIRKFQLDERPRAASSEKRVWTRA
jgi:hypothetical protein